jgi:hypothetical protein
MKLLALCVAAALVLTMLVPPSVPVHAQSTSKTGKASQTDTGGKTSRTGSTSKQ